ncbi:hypothetical protein [Halorubrum sp. T3]|uniref:hypothetical protein n=1 Tax=Halorubrum sp. T3 TaxID=1194088 RepID=UPI0009E2C19C|nr:hypothetical protein [Halorubrum sp. T3]
MSDRSAQRAARVLAAGALEEFVADPLTEIYKRAAGALEEFVADPLTEIYKRAAGALPVFAADSLRLFINGRVGPWR